MLIILIFLILYLIGILLLFSFSTTLDEFDGIRILWRAFPSLTSLS